MIPLPKHKGQITHKNVKFWHSLKVKPGFLILLINLKTGATQWRAGVGRQRGTKVRGAGERGTESGRLWPPCPPPPTPPQYSQNKSHQPPSWICRARKAGARKKFVPRGWSLGMAEHDWIFALTSPYFRYVLWRNVIGRLIISCDLSSNMRLGTG